MFMLQNRVDKLDSGILHTNQIKFKFKKRIFLIISKMLLKILLDFILLELPTSYKLEGDK
ncbi:UNVERIFIED_ORG: hypothetical protein J2X74_005954 [Bacillus sp. 1751]|nr:hypothetical protein [Bacillus sp. 1751]